jgi:hypothetical protein
VKDFDMYIADVRSQLYCNASEDYKDKYTTYTYSNEDIDGNLDYFKECQKSGLSAYKALLFFKDRKSSYNNMNIEKINTILKDYDNLLALVYNVIKVLESTNRDKYNTSKGVENIEFDNHEDRVYVTCDDSFRDYYDTISFSFPIEWLTKSELELTRLILIEKDIEIVNKRKALEEKELKRLQEQEEKERELLHKLSVKYNNK